MFINCPFCKALVATDPATDLPPDHCPRCAAKLRGIQADVPASAMSTAPRGAGQATVPRLDPAFLLDVPPPEMPLPDGASGSTPSELSSRIHQIVALETPVAGSAAPVIAPIATMLKPADDEPAPLAGTDAAAHGAGAVVPTPTPTPTPTPVAGSAPPAETRATNPPASTAASIDRAAAGTTAAAPPAAPSATTVAAERTTPAASALGATVAAAGRTPAATPAARALPSFARRHARLGVAGFHWKLLVAIAALALLLVLQLLLADRALLAADARWRPLLSNVCGVFGCTLPPWREPTAFTVLAREVRPHPSTPGALRVTATFRNDARWPQPWPQVRLTLSDINGNAVAARDFSARDYLGAVPAQVELHSGQSASIAMDIVEPGPRSVAFDFELH
ncbi:DUF3426 domain-containing protein [Luteimonas sp. 22616]|uniref:DUF3426 domain-containing protein n=1 Tax=Luteimonas sp. 22616 TaxID=3453951 RepID=UPI003F83F2E6